MSSPEWQDFWLESARWLRIVIVFIIFAVLSQWVLGKTFKESLRNLLKGFRLEFRSEMGRINAACSVFALFFCFFIPSIVSFLTPDMHGPAVGSRSADLARTYFVFFLLFMCVSMAFVFFDNRRRSRRR